MIKNIVTIAGAPSVGKSTVGKVLSLALNAEFIDLDEEIEQAIGCSISAIFKNKGEEYFRIIEKNKILQIVESKKNKTIFSVGGGALLNHKSKELLTNKTILFTLTAMNKTLIYRNRGTRPLASNKSVFEKLLKTRKEHYASLPNKISTENKSPMEVANIIMKEVRSLWFLEDQLF